MPEIKNRLNASGALDEDQTDGVSCVLSSRAMWQNLCGPSLI